MQTPGKVSRALAGGGLASVLSLAALATLTACSGPGGSGNTAVDVGLSSNTQPVSAAPPGKYQTLPEACGAISPNTLRVLLPDSSDYDGDAMATYDIDRRVGCSWNGSVADGDRILSIDLERVVSYDPAVSDEDRAAQDFTQLAQAAHIPSIPHNPGQSAPASGSQSPSSSGAPAAAPVSLRASSPAPARPASDTDGVTPSAPASSPAPLSPSGGESSPRLIGGIGDEAYLDDVVVTQDANIHRDVTIVFRTANVLVTVVFSQYSTGTSAIPPSGELQLGADSVAQEVENQFD